MKTHTPKKSEIQFKWYLVDAKGQTLGRLATKVAAIIRGKNKPNFTPHLITGDYVVVINAKEIVISGNKATQKAYITHSGYLGGLKQVSYAKRLAENPVAIIEQAVSGMIPRNKLRTTVLSHLKVFAGANHDHAAQKPEVLEL